LNYSRVSKDDLNYLRLVKLNNRSVYSHERTNENPEQPNSACESLWHLAFDTNYDNYACARLLAAFLNEPTFNTLRT